MRTSESMVENSIICGDAKLEMKLMSDSCIDAILTDPPYGVTKDDDDYIAIFWLEEAYRVLKDDSALMCFCGQATIREFWNAAEAVGFKWLNTIVWHYKNTFKRERRRFAIQYDPILYFAKGDFVHNIDEVRVPYLYPERLKYPTNNSKKKGWMPNPKGAICGDVWEFKALNSSNHHEFQVGHKWQKPIGLFDRMIKATCKSGDLILDPFVGSGTSCLAAKNNNVKYIGIDIDQNNVDLAKTRIDNTLVPQMKASKVQRDIFDE